MQARALLALALMLVPANASAQAIFRLENGNIPTTPITSQMKYYGGRVISNVKIVEVAWGASVDSAYMTQLQGFYTAIVKSPFVDWMSEYDTVGLDGFADLQPGSNQHIGRGAFIGSFVITPTNKSTTLSDTDIQTELVAQITSAALPAPDLDAYGNVDSLYMIDFPAGTSITLVNIQSCSSFGAYHFTLKYQGNSVPYGVHPNCGYSFDTSTIIHSHELAEAMTDAEVGLIETNTTNLSARPLAWVTLATTAWNSQEVGDVCEGTNTKIGQYAVQKIWSNYAQACVAQIPICDGVLVPPDCRPCGELDDGSACTNACATSGPKAGQCVTCTTKYDVACSGATPACDDATYTCVACATNVDCTAPAAPTCDKAVHTCRACATDGECSTDKVCDVSSDATQGQCVACNTDAQCKSDEQCNASHTCIPKVVDAGAEVGDVEEVSGNGSGCGCDVAPRNARVPLAGLFTLALVALVRRKKPPQ